MSEQNLIERIQLLEYHQKLLLKRIASPQLDFFRLVIEKGIKEQEVNRFYTRV